MTSSGRAASGRPTATLGGQPPTTEALHDAFVAGAYTDHLADFARRADEALAALADAEEPGVGRRAALIAYRGLLLADLRRHHEAWAELQRSMGIAPTWVAARGMVPVWGALRRTDEVAETCGRILPAMRASDDRYNLLDLCVTNMRAPTDAAALAWAPPEALAFYREQRRRRSEAAAWAAMQAQQTNDMNQAQQAANMAAQQANDMAVQSAMAAAQQAAQTAVPPP